MLSSARTTTSSRQSPRISALKLGFDFVLLLVSAPVIVKRRVSLDRPYLSMRGAPLPLSWPSSNSRTASASHQTRKFDVLGRRPMLLPALPKSAFVAPPPEAHISAPGLPAQMSPATPRPT